MPKYTTSKGREVVHIHLEDPGGYDVDYTPTEISAIRRQTAAAYPNVVESAPPTRTHNCHGYAHARAHAWFNDPVPFITDDYKSETMKDPKVGDVVVYRKDGVHTHSGVVFLVGDGEITQVRSKWGATGLYLHDLRDVPEEYGEPVYLLRRTLRVEGAVVTDRLDAVLEELTSERTYWRVALASTPAVARQIVQGLPAVKRLIELGEEAAPAVLDLFTRTETQENEHLSAVLLYCLQIVGAPAAVGHVARYIVGRKMTPIAAEFAPVTLLVLAGIELGHNSVLEVALREAPSLAR